MIITVKKQIGRTVLEFAIEEKDEKEALAQAIFFAEKDVCLNKLPDGKTCGNENISWGVNKAKTNDGTFTYVKRFCPVCKGTSTMGTYKTGGFFWNKWETYQPKEKEETTQPVGLEADPFDSLPQ